MPANGRDRLTERFWEVPGNGTSAKWNPLSLINKEGSVSFPIKIFASKLWFFDAENCTERFLPNNAVRL
jgi:hypothetical protein